MWGLSCVLCAWRGSGTGTGAHRPEISCVPDLASWWDGWNGSCCALHLSRSPRRTAKRDASCTASHHPQTTALAQAPPLVPAHCLCPRTAAESQRFLSSRPSGHVSINGVQHPSPNEDEARVPIKSRWPRLGSAARMRVFQRRMPYVVFSYWKHCFNSAASTDRAGRRR